MLKGHDDHPPLTNISNSTRNRDFPFLCKIKNAHPEDERSYLVFSGRLSDWF
jgi:hypothetical protein